MKQVNFFLVLLLISTVAHSQTVTPNPGPYQNISTKYQYTWQKWSGGLWNLGKLIQEDSAYFKGIIYVPTALDADSNNKAANTEWVRKWVSENVSPGVPGVPVSSWATAGNYTPSDPTPYRLGLKDSMPLHFITNSQIRLTIPDNGIKRNYGLANKFLVIDTTTKELYYMDGGAGSPSVVSYGKNATLDSTVLLLSDGTRYAAKDSVGSGGGSGSIDYVVPGFGIKVDSINRTYTVSADTNMLALKDTIKVKMPLYVSGDTLQFLKDSSSLVKNIFLKTGTDSVFKTINGVDSFAFLLPSGSSGSTVTFYGKNATLDSTILVLSDGTRYAAKDSVGGGGGASYTDSMVQIGNIYNKNNLLISDFVDVGTGASQVGNAIRITGGANIQTEYLAIKDTVLYDAYKMKVRFKVDNTPTGTTYGIGIGFQSVVSGLSLLIKADLSTGTDKGKLLMYSKSLGLLPTLINGLPITFGLNDTLEITFEKDDKYFKSTLTNLSDSSNTYTIFYTYNTILASYLPSTGNFSLYRFGGDYLVNSVNVSTNSRKYAPIAFIGDSKTQLFAANEFYNAYPYLIDKYLKNSEIALPSIINFGGGSDKTTQIIARLNSIINSKPSIAFMAIGSNDLRGGATLAQTMVNYKFISNALTLAGIDVWHLLPFPENSINMTDFVDSIVTVYPTKYIDTWNPLRNGTALAAVYSGDGIHPNRLGHSVIARQIIKSGLVDRFEIFKAKLSTDVPVGFGGGLISSNISIGANSLVTNLTGTNITTMGFESAQNNKVDYTTAFGSQTLKSNTTGSFNSAFGMNAMKFNTTGSSNTGIGINSLYLNTTGSLNTVVGFDALRNNVTGSSNTAIGLSALNLNTASSNTAIGANSLEKNTTGSLNTAVGSEAGRNSTTADQLTAVGWRAFGLATTTGAQNSGLGVNVGRNVTSGARNTYVGVNSGFSNVTGSNNVSIGYNSGFYNTVSDKLFISGDSTKHLIYGDFATKQVQIGSSLSNPTLTPSAALEIISTDKGLLIPRMTKANRNSISSPAAGLTVVVIGEAGGEYLSWYNSSTAGWVKVTSTAD